MNFSWSLLLLTVSSIVLYIAAHEPTRYAERMALSVGLFWAIHGAYVWFNPMPLPQSLLWLKFVLTAFPATLVLLHWVPVLAYRSERERLSGATPVGAPVR